MARISITKGKNFEREVAAKLREVYPEARRGLQTRDGTEAPDVAYTPYWIECKVGKRINIPAALTQAQEATDGRPPLAICKLDGQPPTATLKLDDFIKLLADGDRNEGRGAGAPSGPSP